MVELGEQVDQAAVHPATVATAPAVDQVADEIPVRLMIASLRRRSIQAPSARRR